MKTARRLEHIEPFYVVMWARRFDAVRRQPASSV